MNSVKRAGLRSEEVAPDHKRSAFVFDCWHLVLHVVPLAYWASHILNAIATEEIKLALVGEKDFSPLLLCPPNMLLCPCKPVSLILR